MSRDLLAEAVQGLDRIIGVYRAGLDKLWKTLEENPEREEKLLAVLDKYMHEYTVVEDAKALIKQVRSSRGQLGKHQEVKCGGVASGNHTSMAGNTATHNDSVPNADNHLQNLVKEGDGIAIQQVCPNCGSADWWCRQNGERVCSRCHPRPSKVAQGELSL